MEVKVYTKPFGEIIISMVSGAMVTAEAEAKDAARRAEEAAASVNVATPEETAQYLGLEVETDGVEG